MADEMHVIKGNCPVKDKLMFWNLVGHEGLSRPAAYELTVLSELETIEPKDILGREFDVEITFLDEGEAKHKRHFQGYAVRFLRARKIGRFFEYRISLRSWFWLLTKRRNSRIRQDKTVLDVVEDTLKDAPISKVQKLDKKNVKEPHKPRRYCVQFEETDYQFLSRLMEEEGIYYWFDAHQSPGLMYLSDSSAVAHQPLPVKAEMEYRPEGQSSKDQFNEILAWVAGRRFESGKYVSTDKQYLDIKKTPKAIRPVPDEHELADFEVFEFPGNYLKNEDIGAIPDDDVENVGKVRGHEIVGLRDRHWALTRWPDVAVGKSFKYKGDPDASRNGEYVIAGCTMVVAHPGYEGMPGVRTARTVRAALQSALVDDAFNAEAIDVLTDLIDSSAALSEGGGGVRAFLMSTFSKKVEYKPPRLTPRATMPGPQSAIVVGRKGEELDVDEHGRVKVHFHWNRYDNEKVSDEHSSCWVRVSQPWAGQGWGGYFAPRIGQEVIVDFINGDPDRPIIVGRVYNDDQPIPYKSPTQSGFKTRSTPKGSTSNFNEFRFEDKKGSEQVYLHAEKNYDIEVESDETHHVGHDRSKTIDNDETVHVKHNRTETVDNDESITIGMNRTEKVGVNEDITVGASRTEKVGASESVAIGASRSHTVGVSDTLTVGAARTEIIGAALTQTVGAAVTQSVGAAFTQNVVGAITVASGGPTTFTATGGFTIIAPGGTKIIDMELSQIGGTIKEGYASKLDFNGIASEANAGKMELTGYAVGEIRAKFEHVSVECKSAQAVVKQIASDIKNHQTKLLMAAAVLFL